MRVHLASDHAGFDLKAVLTAWLLEHGHEPVDHGAATYEELDDYPPYCLAAAQAVVDEPGSLGVVLGGSGNGEQIAANKVDGVRAALAYDDDTARLAREHNDANVLALGARTLDDRAACRLLALFVDTPFSGEERHLRRIGLLSDYERSRSRPD